MKHGDEHKIEVTFDWAKNSFSLWKMSLKLKMEILNFADKFIYQKILNSREEFTAYYN